MGQFGSITLEGGDKLRAVLAQLGEQATEKLGGALFRQANFIMTESQDLCPVDIGTLRASGHVELPEMNGTSVSVQLGYGGAAEDYAVIVHEDLNPKTFSVAGTGPKYLERPMLEAASTLEAKLARDLKLEVKR